MPACHSQVHRNWCTAFYLIVFSLVAARPGYAAPTIANPSFEADTFNVNDGSVADNGPITGWTANDALRTGLNPSNGANPWANNGIVPAGSQVAYLSGTGLPTTLSTTITGLTSGTVYVVRFGANRNSQFPAVDPRVVLNGGTPIFFSVGAAVESAGSHTKPYKRFAFVFTATGTTAPLAITNDDSILLVDNFTVAEPSLHVTSTADDGPGSLRYALSDAAAIPGANTITFAPGLSGQTITLTDEIVVDDADAVDVDASMLADGITIDGGAGTNRIFYADNTSGFTLQRFTLTGGNGTGANSFAQNDGGAIRVTRSTVTLQDCTLHGNSVSSEGGAIHVAGSASVLTLNQCTFYDNSAVQDGGALYNSSGLGSATVIANQCTFFNNEAGTLSGGRDGGAILNQANLTLTHCTISGNTADNAGGGVETQFGTATLNYCIIAGNITPGSSSKDMRASGNLVLNGTSIIPVFNNSASTSGSGTISTADPLLGTLADNSGPTRTIALGEGSPAIDAATGSGVTTDQRGLAVSGPPDLGAFEVLSSDSTLTSLVLNGVTLTPGFDSGTLDYTSGVDFATTSLTVTPTAAGGLAAAITVDGTTVASGAASSSLPLMPGNTMFTTVVTAPNGFTSTTYTVSIERLPADTDGDGNGFTDLEEYHLARLPSAFHVGDVVSIDLGAILLPLPAGQSLVVTGLPKGVKFDPGTGLITGTVLAPLKDSLVQIAIVQDKISLSSIDLDFSVVEYPFAGQFEALIEDGSGLAVGKAKLVITKPGAFSATLELQGQRRRSARGSFANPPGGDEQTVSVDFPAIGITIPATTVEFLLSSESDLVAGAQETNSLRGFRMAKAGRAPTQTVTVAFENDIAGDRTTTPGGTGYATGKASSRGLLSLRGLLGDAQRLSTSLLLSQTNQAVVFVQPYRDKTVSFFGGIITVGDLGQPERGGSSESEPAGLQWRKITRAADKSYPLGIGVGIPVALTGKVSNWVRLPSAEALALSLGLDARDVFANYTAPTTDVLPDRFSLRNNYSLLGITPGYAVRWSGKANARSGTFAGRLTLAAPAAGTVVSGVLLQDQRFGNQVGTGLMKIPTTTAVRGSFETAGIQFGQTEGPPVSSATFTVTTNADSGAGSLRQAIANAAASAGPDVIDFSPALDGQTIGFDSEIAISDSATLEIDASSLSGGLVLDGELNNRVFTINFGALDLRGLTVTRGKTTGFDNGGAILNNGATLAVDRCTFTDNTSSNGGGAVFNSNGGNATFVQCTFSGNSTTGSSDGGAIFNTATLTLIHCTISGNAAGNAGGGVEAFSGSVTLEHTIVAGNTTPFAAGNDLRHSFGSFHLIGLNFITSLTGTPTGSGTTSVADPLLDALASNGGNTQTMALQTGSPAINAGTDSTITGDQRGRPISGIADIGAFEFQQGTSDSGFTEVQKGQLEALLAEYRVGDTVNIDLGGILFPLAEGRTVAATGLPRGLKFSTSTGLITGTILAEPGNAPVRIAIKRGRKMLDSVVFDLSVAPYPFAGQFEALIEDGSGLPVGKAKLVITTPGAFSATLELQGQKRRSTKGKFTNPSAGTDQTVSVDFAAISVFPTTTVEILISSASDLVAGTQEANTLRGFRLAKAGRTPTQTVTVAFENDIAGDRINTPGGTGCATGKASSRGSLPLKGLLGDAQKLSTSLLLSQTNQAVVFFQPYNDKTVSFFGGIITVGDLGQPERGGSSESEPAGLQWRKIARAADKSYPLGIGVTTPLGVTGKVSSWTPVPSAEGLALSLGLDLHEIQVDYTAPPSEVLPDVLSLRNTYSLIRLSPGDAVPWKGRANARSGTFASRMTLASPAAKTMVSGVLLQDQSFGTQVGAGMMKIPTITGVRGSFETAGIRLSNRVIN